MIYRYEIMFLALDNTTHYITYIRRNNNWIDMLQYLHNKYSIREIYRITLTDRIVL